MTMAALDSGPLPPLPRPVLAAVTALLAAALVAGCTSPAAPAGPVSPSGGDLRMATTGASPTCSAKTLVEDDQLLLQGGRGGQDFLLRYPCQLRPSLTLREAAGALLVRLEGPGGTLFERSFEGLSGPGSTLNIGHTSDNSTSNGHAAAGTYHYTFTAEGVASFEFRVESG